MLTQYKTITNSTTLYFKIKEIKNRYRRRISELEREIEYMQTMKERDSATADAFGKTDWEKSLDEIFYYPDEVIKLNRDYIINLMDLEREFVNKVLKGI